MISRTFNFHAFRSALSVAALLLCGVSAQAAAADTCGRESQDAASTTAQKILDTLATINGVPGMGASVWHDGQVAWVGCTGWRDLESREPVERDTRFRLASVSKLIGATAAGRLAQDGQLDIDAPIGETLPWLRAPWSSMTTRQLAAHISGTPHYSEHELDTLGHVHYPNSREASGIFSHRPLVAKPGTAYRYSSWGYTLLGAVIEAKSGRHTIDYLADTLTGGLAIAADSDDPAGRASALYDIEHGVASRVARSDMSYTLLGGGLAATPEALVSFAGRILAHQAIRRDTWSWMLQPTRFANGAPVHAANYDVAFGWRVGSDRDGARIAHHAGTTTGARSMLMLWPDHGVASAVLSNASWIATMDSTAELLAAPFRPAPSGLVPAACPVGRRYAGTWERTKVEGSAIFHLEQGRCVGTIEASGALRDHFHDAYVWPEQALKVVSLSSDGGLSRAALITPFGLYDLRATHPNQWSVQLSPGKALDLTIP
ncbi:serine hydrolase domain-containing protein [Pseudoxanthomonas sp.]|uniref:serine hydrolase domain-containing protein n=1 Tax=Pseudoxanthomonas sp. TaxID=1871049 RepID=UPI003F8132C5